MGRAALCRFSEIPAAWQRCTRFLTVKQRLAALKINGAMSINGLLLSSLRTVLKSRSVTLSAAQLFGDHLRGLLDIVPMVDFWRNAKPHVERLPTTRTVAVYIDMALDCSGAVEKETAFTPEVDAYWSEIVCWEQVVLWVMGETQSRSQTRRCRQRGGCVGSVDDHVGKRPDPHDARGRSCLLRCR